MQGRVPAGVGRRPHRRRYGTTSDLPRKINLLAHHTLTAAALARAKLATADHVQAALPEVA